MAASLDILVIRSTLADWQPMKKECIHARHRTTSGIIICTFECEVWPWTKKLKYHSETGANSQTDTKCQHPPPPHKDRVMSEPEFLNFKGPWHRFQGIDSANLCSQAGRYDNPIPYRFLAPIDCSKILAQVNLGFGVFIVIWSMVHRYYFELWKERDVTRCFPYLEVTPMFVIARMQKNMEIPKETWEKNKFSFFYRKTWGTKKITKWVRNTIQKK